MMSLRRQTCIVLAAAALAVVGCSSSSKHTQASDESVQIRNNAVSAISDTQKDLTQIDQQLTQNRASLNNLMTYQGDLQPVYSNFSSNVDKSKSLDRTLGSDVDRIATTSANYTSDWSYKAQTIADQNMRQDSLKAQADARKQEGSMVQGINDFRATYLDYIRKLEDVQAFAASNLTAGGIQQLHSHTQALDSSEQAVKQKLASLQGQLGQVAANWRTTTWPEVNAQTTAAAAPAGEQMAGARMNPATAPTTAP